MHTRQATGSGVGPPATARPPGRHPAHGHRPPAPDTHARQATCPRGRPASTPHTHGRAVCRSGGTRAPARPPARPPAHGRARHNTRHQHAHQAGHLPTGRPASTGTATGGPCVDLVALGHPTQPPARPPAQGQAHAHGHREPGLAGGKRVFLSRPCPIAAGVIHQGRGPFIQARTGRP